MSTELPPRAPSPPPAHRSVEALLKPGLYEKLLNRAELEQLKRLAPGLEAQIRSVDPAEMPLAAARFVITLLVRALSSRKEVPAPEVLNAILSELRKHTESNVIEEGDLVADNLQELLSILPVSAVTQKVVPIRPAVPLTQAALLVNAAGDLNMSAEISKELASADRVDLICSFLKWSGYRILEPALSALHARKGQLRVLTTCYLGATEVKVLDALSELGEVKVSYNSKRTRLHAKAWLFHRDTGYSTAYIGSSNLSSAALVDGVEWNVRLSQTENGAVLEKFRATFDNYWEDPEFELYDKARDRQRFLIAVRNEWTLAREVTDYRLEVHPYRYQQEILEKLQAEREVHGRARNLVVAATGCGKTVIAALDYKRFRNAQPGRKASLLFVAHRNEILTQSLQTFRAVLQDGQFGDLWTGLATPQQDEHLFASVQKLNNVELEQLGAERFDVIIVDEFHHSEAPTYRRLLNYFRPRILLGLTATPERADGQSVLDWFDGRIAAELRVWDAVERGFLSPFQYFGLHDNVDIRHVR